MDFLEEVFELFDFDKRKKSRHDELHYEKKHYHKNNDCDDGIKINSGGAHLNENKKFCRCCGEVPHENSNFCHNCGTEIIKNTVCQNCGEKLSDNSKFCHTCGKKIN